MLEIHVQVLAMLDRQQFRNEDSAKKELLSTIFLQSFASTYFMKL